MGCGALRTQRMSSLTGTTFERGVLRAHLVAKRRGQCRRCRRRQRGLWHPMTARGLWRGGGGDGRRRRTCVNTSDAPMAHTPLGERKGVRSKPSLDDGVERQVAHNG